MMLNRNGDVRASTGKDFITMVFGTWLIGGVFIDGYAHNHGVVETFFTPWHAILYSGFIATALWIAWMVCGVRRQTGRPWLQAIPQGYGLGVVGIVVFLAGGLGDMIWHTVFGIEKSISALLSPTHLILLLGALMILSSPFRSGWQERGTTAPGWKKLAPVLLSVELTTAAVAFFLMYAWMFRTNVPAEPNVEWVRLHAARMMQDEQSRGLGFILIDTLVMMFPVFLLLSRWKTPFGTVAFHMAFLGTVMCVLDGFETWQTIWVMAAGGLVADILLRALRPGPERMWGYRLIAIVVPVVVWGLYYAGMHIAAGIGWPPELWVGSIVEAALASLGLSLLGLPSVRKGA